MESKQNSSTELVTKEDVSGGDANASVKERRLTISDTGFHFESEENKASSEGEQKAPLKGATLRNVETVVCDQNICPPI